MPIYSYEIGLHAGGAWTIDDYGHHVNNYLSTCFDFALNFVIKKVLYFKFYILIKKIYITNDMDSRACSFMAYYYRMEC